MTPESESAVNPSDSGAIRRSALLGQRQKSRPQTIEKPALLPTKKPEPASEASPKRPPRKAPAKAPADPLEPLRLQVQELSQALASRPSWDDLRALEDRLVAQLRPAAKPEEIAYLELERQLAERSEALRLSQDELRTRHEELEELSGIVSEFQEQNEQAQQRIQLLTGRLHELHDQLTQAQDELQEARAEFSRAQEMRVEAEHRCKVGEGFLREALLSLLSPGDEFNEDLVEQIQHFLAL